MTMSCQWISEVLLKMYFMQDWSYLVNLGSWLLFDDASMPCWYFHELFNIWSWIKYTYFIQYQHDIDASSSSKQSQGWQDMTNLAWNTFLTALQRFTDKTWPLAYPVWNIFFQFLSSTASQILPCVMRLPFWLRNVEKFKVCAQ